MWVKKFERPIPRRKMIEDGITETAGGSARWKHQWQRTIPYEADRRSQGSSGQDENCEGPKSHERRRFRECSASVPQGTTQISLPNVIDRPGHAGIRAQVAERRDEKNSATHDLRRSVTKSVIDLWITSSSGEKPQGRTSRLCPDPTA